MVYLEALDQKLLVLAMFTPEGTKNALAHAIGLKPQKLSLMLRDDNEGRRQFHVQPAELERLAKFMVDRSGGQMTSEAAKRLLAGPFPLFAARIFLPLLKLDEVLTVARQTLQVRADVVDRTAFNMVEAPFLIPVDAIFVPRAYGVRFKIDTQPERQLIVLYHVRPKGWFRLAPGHWHAGSIESTETHFPNDPFESIGFGDNPSPCYRFVFIEAALSSTPVIGEPGPDQCELSSDEMTALALTLNQMPDAAVRWQQIFVAPAPRAPAQS